MHVISVDADECDACPHTAHVKAYLHAQMPSGNTVSYCAHHGTEYLSELTRQAAVIIDLRHQVHE